MTAAPFLKWVGGKGKLSSKLSALLPADIGDRRYFEPFVGGGAMFFATKPRRAFLFDINADLINTYRSVRDSLDVVQSALEGLFLLHSSDAYYAVRAAYNERKASGPVRAAQFIYLNKTCFNGVHRVNRKGDFNVPVGRYTKPQVDMAALTAASYALLGVELHAYSFEHITGWTVDGDFIYLDPPYDPASSTANFTAYAQDGFTRANQIQLRDVCVELDRQGCAFMLSSSDTQFIRDLYRDFQIDTVTAARSVGAAGKSRSSVQELVIRNYSGTRVVEAAE